MESGRQRSQGVPGLDGVVRRGAAALPSRASALGLGIVMAASCIGAGAGLWSLAAGGADAGWVAVDRPAAGSAHVTARAVASQISPPRSPLEASGSAHLRATLHHGFSDPLIAWRPDGGELAVVGYMGRTVRFWDVRTPSPSGVLHELDGQIEALAYSPDGTRLATGLGFLAAQPSAPNVLVWDVGARKLLRRLAVQVGGRSQSISALAYAPGGRHLAAAVTRPTRTLLYDLTGAVVTAELPTPGGLGPIEIDPSGELVAYPSHDSRDGFSLKIVRVSDGAIVTGDVRHADQSRALAFDPSGRLVAVGDADGGVTVYDARTGRRERRLMGHGEIVWAVRFLPGGDRLVSAAVDGVRVWSTRNGAQVSHCRLGGPHFHRMSISPGADRVVTGGQDELRVWDVCGESTGERR